jgi:hypothetical protein
LKKHEQANAQPTAKVKSLERDHEIEAKIAQSVEKHTHVKKALHLSLLDQGIDAEEAQIHFSIPDLNLKVANSVIPRADNRPNRI